MRSARQVLFIAWDGPESNYLESLFLPIFGRLRDRGFHFHVLQYGWGDGAFVARTARAADAAGCVYVRRTVTRCGGAGAVMSVGAGIRVVERYITEHGIDVVMPRSVLPTAMVLPRAADRARLVMDADGLAQDERVDFAGWRATGLRYRAYRDVEAQGVRVADAVITRTSRARDVLVARAGSGCEPGKIFVVPNGSDPVRFAPGTDVSRQDTRRALGVSPEAPLVVYVGALGPHYYPAAMMHFFAATYRRDPRARLVVLTGQLEDATRMADEANLERGVVVVRRVPAAEVGPVVAAADLGLGLRASSFSQCAVSPIKVGEYLLCGTPVLATHGVGDLDQQLDDSVAMFVDPPDSAALEAAAESFLARRVARDAQRAACRARGLAVFSLGACVAEYERALTFALSRPPRKVRPRLS